METIEDLARHYHDAEQRSARHEAQLWRARHDLAAGGAGAGAIHSEKPLVIAPRRRKGDTATPVALLASFNAPGSDILFLLKAGLSRVGVNEVFGDYEQPKTAARVIEARQFLVVHHQGQVLVMDDHSTGQSLVLKKDTPRLSGMQDPRYEDGAHPFVALLHGAPPGVVALDWEGTVTVELTDGDVILTQYGALVFGLVG